MQELAERAYFATCLAVGRLLRASRYATVRVERRDGELQVRKRRSFHAPLLVWMGGTLVRILAAGVRVLPQRGWEERERELYTRLYGRGIRVEADGTLVLPCLPGETLARVLEASDTEEPRRTAAIQRAVSALADLHRLGFTHGDAMAENVMVGPEGAVARWFDFETVHDSGRTTAWRRADDVRALLATCLVRTRRASWAHTLRLVLDGCADAEVTRLVAASFTTVWRRPLAFHLGQAPLSIEAFREIGRLLSERLPG